MASNAEDAATAVDIQTPFRLLPWDVIEHVFQFLEPTDVVSTACVNHVHYALAHGHLWRKPHLSLTQAMIFTRFVYRRPIFTNMLPPSIGDVIQTERPLCVKTVSLYLENEISGMLDIARESVVRRILQFCPGAHFEVHLNQRDEQAWQEPLTAAEKERIRLVLHVIEEKAEEVAAP